MKKYKYKYWHIIKNISKEYAKYNPSITEGLLMGRKDKHDYPVTIIDRSTGDTYPRAYDLEYIGRLPSEATNEEVCKFVDKNKKANKGDTKDNE